MDAIQKNGSHAAAAHEKTNFVGGSAFQDGGQMNSMTPPPLNPQASSVQLSPDPSAAPIQRLVAVDPGPTVFTPRGVRKETHAAFNIGTYQAGLQTILGGNPVIRNGNHLETFLNTQDIKDPDTRRDVFRQMQDENTVYAYNNLYSLAAGTPTSEHPVMDAKDMGDSSGVVPGGYVHNQACVLQALQSLGKQVPGTGAGGTNQQHHNYATGQNLDYRTDSDYLDLYVNHYNLNLISSTLTPWNAVNWGALGGAGDYLCTTYGGAVAPGGAAIGHMVGVRVTAGVAPGTFNTQIFDQQNLTRGALMGGGGFVRYIFT